MAGLEFIDCQQTHGDATKAAVQAVDYSQRESNGRHRCAACAYELGLLRGREEARREMREALGLDE
jgi:hypothetical protein